jgi:hypothetical protein
MSNKRIHLENVLAKANGRFVGVENIKADGSVRRWSIASRLPSEAVNAITEKPRQLPPHMLVVYDTGKHAWRTLNCDTLRRIWCGDTDIVFTE